MADLFGEWVPAEWIKKVIESCTESPQWNFLFLTKNPKRYLEFDFPENAWLGATADTAARLECANEVFIELHQILASKNKWNVTFLSCEPLTENISGTVAIGRGSVDWVIIGAMKNSENTERQPKWEWVENLLISSRKADAGVYFKPNLTVRPMEYPKG